MRAAIYARKSQDQGPTPGDDRSVTRQAEHARIYVAKKGWTVADEHIYVDDGISGAEFAKRPAFIRLMNALTPQAPFDVLVMSEESRLGRELIETSYALKRIVTAGVRVFYYLEDRERTLDSATDRLLMSVTAFAADMEREKARERTRDALIRKAQAGKVAGGAVYGYRNEAVYGEPDAGGQRRRLHTERVIDSSEATVVRRIFQMTAEGLGVKRIAKRLNAEGVLSPPPRGKGRSRSWAPSTIREMLYRDLYRGLTVYGKVRKRDAWGQKRYLECPESEWVKLDSPALRIVSDEEWARAHERLTASRANYVKATGGLVFGRPVNAFQSKYLLTGLASCAVCQGSFVARTMDFKKHGRRPYYCCSYNHHRGATVCANRLPLDAKAAEREVLRSIEATLKRQDLIEQAVEFALADLRPQENKETERERLQRRIREIEAELARLVAALVGGDSPTLGDEVRKRDRERAECERRLKALAQPARAWDPRRTEHMIRARLREYRELLGRQVAPARQILREALEGRIVFTPRGDKSYEFTGTLALGGILAGLVPQAMVTPAGFEPAISTLKGSRPGPG